MPLFAICRFCKVSFDIFQYWMIWGAWWWDFSLHLQVSKSSWEFFSQCADCRSESTRCRSFSTKSSWRLHLVQETCCCVVAESIKKIWRFPKNGGYPQIIQTWLLSMGKPMVCTPKKCCNYWKLVQAQCQNQKEVLVRRSMWKRPKRAVQCDRRPRYVRPGLCSARSVDG